MLVPSLPPPPKPLDAAPILDPDPPLDGEGEPEEKGVNPEEGPSPEAMNELQDFHISVGSHSCSCCTSCTYANRLTSGLTLTLMLLRVTSPLGTLLAVL
jgi:hypothetical protein